MIQEIKEAERTIKIIKQFQSLILLSAIEGTQKARLAAHALKAQGEMERILEELEKHDYYFDLKRMELVRKDGRA